MPRIELFAALLLFGLSLSASSKIKDEGWWKNRPVYQIYPRSFMDSNGDGIGDLKGITSKITHFVEIGVYAIWLSPIYVSPMADFGYDISDFTAIAPEYGTMGDFEELIEYARFWGIKVILDLVPNHASDQHEWFQKSVKKIGPYTDYFMWKKGDPTTPPNNWISVFGKSAWTYNEERGEWYFHQFLPEQPDLNYRNPAVRQAMKEVMLFWLDKGVDGFRVDAVPHLFEIDDLRDEPLSNVPGALEDEYAYLDHIYTKDQPESYQFVKEMRELLDTYAKETNSHERIMMTEAYTGLQKTVEYYDAGSHVPFNFKFIMEANNGSTPKDFKEIIDTWMAEADMRNGTANWVMGNHDRPRTESRYPGRGDQMIMLEMILPGVPVTYYGEEIGMVDKDDITYKDTVDPQGILAGPDRYKKKSRDPCRTPFQWNSQKNAGFSDGSKTWLPVNDNYEHLNLEAQKSVPNSHFNLFRNLTNLKYTSRAVVKGTLKTLVSNNNKVLTIVRAASADWEEIETVFLVMNFDLDQDVSVDVSDQVPDKESYFAKVKIATPNSALQHGKMVNLTNVTLNPGAAVVIVVTEPPKRKGIK